MKGVPSAGAGQGASQGCGGQRTPRECSVIPAAPAPQCWSLHEASLALRMPHLLNSTIVVRPHPSRC